MLSRSRPCSETVSGVGSVMFWVLCSGIFRTLLSHLAFGAAAMHNSETSRRPRPQSVTGRGGGDRSRWERPQGHVVGVHCGSSPLPNRSVLLGRSVLCGVGVGVPFGVLSGVRCRTARTLNPVGVLGPRCGRVCKSCRPTPGQAVAFCSFPLLLWIPRPPFRQGQAAANNRKGTRVWEVRVPDQPSRYGCVLAFVACFVFRGCSEEGSHSKCSGRRAQKHATTAS